MVAFLRAVNVGGRTVKSPQLVRSFTSLGMENVTTFLASGNVLYDGSNRDVPKQKGRIESRLLEDLGFKTEVILRCIDEVELIAERNAFELTELEKANYTVNVALFSESPPLAMQKEVLKLKSEYDDFMFDKREMYWLCRGSKISTSLVFSKNSLAKAMPAVNTMRNLRTMQRLVVLHYKTKK